jgi:fluoroacetyl-CoA thioesterase
MNVTANIPVGASATRSVEVTRDLTVAHFHSDMPEVYGTPMMIYLMEVAGAAAIEPYLPEGWASVGAAVNIEHLAATPVGFTVTAKAEVIEVRDNLIIMAVEAHDGVETIGRGTHVRAPIDLARFMNRVGQKAMKR